VPAARCVASPSASEASSIGGTRAMAARTEAQLRRIAELEKQISGGGGGYTSAPPTAGGTAGARGASASRASGSGEGARGGSSGHTGEGTLGGGTRTMEERLRRLAQLERELGQQSTGRGDKEELDQLLAQWSGGDAEQT